LKIRKNSSATAADNHRYIQFVKKNIYILMISVFHLSCQTNDIDGLWMTESEKWDSYVLAEMSNDSLILKYLSSFNYHLLDKPQLFIADQGNTFSNDSFQIEVNLTDSLELITYKNDSLIEIEKFYKLNLYKPQLNIIEFKSELLEKSVQYEMKDYKLLIDVVDSIRTYNHNIERTPIGFDYFDIFKFGGEVFFILDTSYPLPIQLIKKSEDNNQILISTELLSQEGELSIIKRKNIIESIKGKWKTQALIKDKIDSIKSIIINQDSFIVDWINDEQSGFEISKLAKDGLYFLTNEGSKPFLLRIEQINKSELLVTNYKNHRESKLKLIKE